MMCSAASRDFSVSGWASPSMNKTSGPRMRATVLGVSGSTGWSRKVSDRVSSTRSFALQVRSMVAKVPGLAAVE